MIGEVDAQNVAAAVAVRPMTVTHSALTRRDCLEFRFVWLVPSLFMGHMCAVRTEKVPGGIGRGPTGDLVGSGPQPRHALLGVLDVPQGVLRVA